MVDEQVQLQSLREQGWLARPSRAIQGLGSVRRQRGYGVVWQPGDTSGAVESRKPPILFLSLPSLIACHNNIADSMLIDQKEMGEKLDYSV